MEITNEEFIVHESSIKENTDGTLTLEGEVLVYTDKGVYSKFIKVRLKNEK